MLRLEKDGIQNIHVPSSMSRCLSYAGKVQELLKNEKMMYDRKKCRHRSTFFTGWNYSELFAVLSG